MIQVLTLALALLIAAPVFGSPLDAPSSSYTRTADVSYGVSARQKLDIYVPNAGAPPLARPVIIFLYGGGWEIGRRERYRFVGKALTGDGFVAVVPDYRVYPDALFPDFIFDAAKAVRWTKDNIARFGGDAARIFVMGHSAGAHIAAMLALDPQYLQHVGMARSQLRGMIGLAGLYDFLPLTSERQEFIFGPAAQRWRSQPINFADGTNPPMLLLTGGDDGTVPPRNTHNLAAKIRARGGPVAVIEYPGVGHADLLTGLAAPFGFKGQVLRAVAAFVREH